VLVAAAFCPHPPVLVPEVASGAAPELAPLRTACDAVLECLIVAGPDVVVLVGAAEKPGEYGPGAWGTLAPYGVATAAGLGGHGGRRRAGSATLPLSLTIGAWLLARTSWAGPVVAHAVPGPAGTAECAALGASLAERSKRVGMVVMGDGSARRSVTAPGYLDPRAEEFDAAVAAALRRGDPEALSRLDVTLASDLMVAGRAAWQALAGAARGSRWRAALCYAEAPYGVGYLVAAWTLRRAPTPPRTSPRASE
jgi:hypothetical protein